MIGVGTALVSVLAYRTSRTYCGAIVGLVGVMAEPSTFAAIVIAVLLLGRLPQFDLAFWRGG